MGPPPPSCLRRADVSRPDVGSSSSTTDARFASASASESRRLCPPDSPLISSLPAIVPVHAGMRASASIVPAGARCTNASLRVNRQHSRSPCIQNSTFGCAGNGESIWVRQGCRARFEIGAGHVFDCGYPGVSPRTTQSCALPALDVAHRNFSELMSATTLPPCVCFESGPERRSLYSCPTPKHASIACTADRGSAQSARCCAASPSGCEPGWKPCAWHAEHRVAWLHPAKTGTSFLLALAHMTNHSLPATAMVPANEQSGLQWIRFFQRFDRTQWFQGSNIFWNDGMSHASISDAVYKEFTGRFFAMFRDPRERGWSAYNYVRGCPRAKQCMSTQSRPHSCPHPRPIRSSSALQICASSGLPRDMLTA